MSSLLQLFHGDDHRVYLPSPGRYVLNTPRGQFSLTSEQLAALIAQGQAMLDLAADVPHVVEVPQP